MSGNLAKELEAMSTISSALSELEAPAIKRVISWVADHYGVSVADTLAQKGPPLGAAAASDHTGFNEVADLFDAVNPKTGAERALAVGYWFQKVQGQQDFDGFSVNSELKNLGHPVANITVAFNDLKDRKPRLAMQVKKSGTSRQARKRYKLTTEGFRKVERMISGVDEQAEK